MTDIVKWVTDMCGPQYMSAKLNGPIKPEDAFKDCKFIGLLFSADWGPPCRSFIKKYLGPFYNEINDEGKKLEIIYVSFDKDFKSYKDCVLQTMSWVALPYDDPHI